MRGEWSGRTDGKYLKALTVQLLQNGIDYGAPVTLTSENNWAYIWEALPEKSAGKSFEYSLKEIGLNGYTTELTVSEESGMQTVTVRNRWTPEYLPLTLETVDIDNPTAPLSGAVFDIFCVTDSEGASVIPKAGNIMGIKERTVITGDNGRFLLDDLLVGTTYCLVETGAPLGYFRSSRSSQRKALHKPLTSFARVTFFDIHP